MPTVSTRSFRSLAAELVHLKVDAIFAFSPPGARAAKNATGSIPIIFGVVSDPIAAGLVKTLARPGSNVTGVTPDNPAVSRLLQNRRTPPSQTWRTFLGNHVRDLVSLDFFTVPSAGLRVFFVLVVLAHHRRRVVHFNVTQHPTAAWAAQQIVDAFWDETAPSYLLRDRDSIYGDAFRHRLKGMGITEVLTAPHSPWQNPFAERLIGSVRRECLDHVVVLGERHLRRILAAYFAYDHRARTRLSLDKGRPRQSSDRAAGFRDDRSVPEVGTIATCARRRSPPPPSSPGTDREQQSQFRLPLPPRFRIRPVRAQPDRRRMPVAPYPHLQPGSLPRIRGGGLGYSRASS